MGYLFQMKRRFIIYAQLAISVVFLLAIPKDAPAFLFWHTEDKSAASEDKSAASDQYAYEEKDAEAEKKRYVVKLDQDKRKCELAIINTKTLIGRSKNRPYLPELYLRLAELYIEKSRLAFFLRKSQEAEGSEQALDQYESNMLKQQAIEIYQRILDSFPNFEYTDKVRFFMAHEYYELGQADEMLKQYQTLISEHPTSQYTPEAHLLLGDYYFNQKQDVDKSTDHYAAVLKFPQSPAVAAARYKLAWCKINVSDFTEALKLFEASVTSAQAAKEIDIDTYRRVDVRLESLVDMAYCYPEVYKTATAEEALVYFKKYAWSRPVYTAVLEKLAYRYYVKKKWAQASPLYRELAMIRQDPEKLLEYAKYIFESVQALGTYEHAEKDVAIIVRALKGQVYSPHTAQADKDKLMNDYELFARDIITHLHAKARQTNSGPDYTIVADAYKQYLDFFGDSPAAAQMTANYSEVLFSAGRYLDAGKQYEKVAPLATVDTKQRQEMLYSAVISYYRALKNKESLNFYQAAFAREGLRSVGKTYAVEYPNTPNTPDVMFNVAWVSYDAGNYQVAVEDLSNFVSRYPRHPAATAAIHLVMDAYHLMENYEGMISYGKSILASGTVQDPKLTQELAQIVRGAESRVVSGMTMAATDDWESTRQELMQVVDSSSKTEMGEQALNALIISSKDQKDLVTLYDSGQKMISTYPNSPHIENTLGVLINTSISIGQLRLLADYMEAYCQRFPQNENSSEFMLKAAQLREGMGQYAQANQLYRRYLSQNKVSLKQMDELVFAMVDNASRIGNDSASLKLLETYQARLSDSGKVRAHAQMAVLNLKANRRSQAGKYSQQVLQAYQPKMGDQDPLLRDVVAQVAYNKVYANSGPYFKLRLKNSIDNKIVEKKAKQLKILEEGYQKVLTYKSSTWALKACFNANLINAEFADFLLNAPLPPDLTPEQKQQYRNLIKQKAQAYTDKAAQYLKTCVTLAAKWEICDPQLSGYFYPAEKPLGRENLLASISGNQPGAEIGRQGLRDPSLADLYRKLLKKPEESQLQFELAKAYLRQKDFRQAALVAQNALSKINPSQRALKANLLNLLGMAHLYCGHDPQAKETFKRALEADEGLDTARINLAGIYRHYGHNDKAAELMKTAHPANLDREGIHPRIGAIYNEYSMQTK
jgi:cellulose synthase operon protein C